MEINERVGLVNTRHAHLVCGAVLLGGPESNVVSAHVDIRLSFISSLCTSKSCQRHFKVRVTCLLVNN